MASSSPVLEFVSGGSEPLDRSKARLVQMAAGLIRRLPDSQALLLFGLLEEFERDGYLERVRAHEPPWSRFLRRSPTAGTNPVPTSSHEPGSARWSRVRTVSLGMQPPRMTSASIDARSSMSWNVEASCRRETNWRARRAVRQACSPYCPVRTPRERHVRHRAADLASRQLRL